MYREKKEPQNVPCLVCKTFAYREDDLRLNQSLVICPTCGKFRFASSADYVDRSPDFESTSYKLSYYLRTISERAFGKRDNSFFPVYSGDDFVKILNGDDPPIREKLHALLQYIANLSRYPGDWLTFDAAHDYSVLGSRNEAEAGFFRQALEAQKLLASQRLAGGNGIRVTTEGLQELERLAQSGSESSNAFIAMWFDPSRRRADGAIQEAIREAGYLPVRLDQVEHLNRIDDEMVARIRSSKFMVADFSGHRHNVYFEAGFMLGLGRPVISLCEKTDIENLHFDTRQYAMIDYTDEEELKKRLKVRILANLGAGPHAVTPE